MRLRSCGAAYSRCLWPPCFASGGRASASSGNAVIVVIDGARYSEASGDLSRRCILRIRDDLRPQRTIHTSVYNRGEAVSLAAHATMLTGNDSWLKWPAEGLRRPATPTLFESLRAATGAGGTKTWTVANDGMPWLEGMTYSTHPLYREDHGAGWCSAPSDSRIGGSVVAITARYHPRLIVVNIHGVEGRGYAGDWARYTERIANADRIVYALWQFIQRGPRYRNRVTLLVTSDHGRRTRDFADHGDCCEGCQHVMFLALGPQTGRGVEVSEPRRYLEDVGVTTGWLLGLAMPYAVDGKLMTELLVAGDAAPLPLGAATEGLALSITTMDEHGIPRAVFLPGETVVAEPTVHNQTDLPVSAYEHTTRRGVCSHGELCDSGKRYGDPPIALAPGASHTAEHLVRIPAGTEPGEWPVVVECRSLDEDGGLVHGSDTVSITVASP